MNPESESKDWSAPYWKAIGVGCLLLLVSLVFFGDELKEANLHKTAFGLLYFFGLPLGLFALVKILKVK